MNECKRLIVINKYKNCCLIIFVIDFEEYVNFDKKKIKNTIHCIHRHIIMIYNGVISVKWADSYSCAN